MKLDINIKSDQQELMKKYEPMVDKQDRYLSVIALVMILGSGIYFRGDFRPVRIMPTHRRFIHRLIKKTCEMFRGKQTNFTLNTNIVLLSIEGYIKDQQGTFMKVALEEEMIREVDPFGFLQPSTSHKSFDIS
jgi:hypothetical protein